MKYYCENCNKLNAEPQWCSACGKKRLREVKQNDFCLLTEIKVMYGEMLKGLLEQSSIPCAAIPSGTGVRTVFALKLENLKIFVPFEFLESATEILKQFSFSIDSELDSEN